MATIREVARSLGLSERAVRLRIDALDGVLDAYLRRGRNNELVFTGEAIAILRRLENLRQGEGIPIRQAAARIREELEGNSVKQLRQTSSNLSAEALARENALLREMVEELRRDRDHWRELALSLQAALPAPRRRRWFWWPFGRQDG